MIFLNFIANPSYKFIKFNNFYKNMLKYKPLFSLLGPIVFLLSIVIFYQNRFDIVGAMFFKFIETSQSRGIVTKSSIIYNAGKAPSYGYSIEYEYKVRKKIYKSSQVDFASKTADDKREYAEYYVKKYPIGDVVTVYYSVNNPNLAALEPKMTRYTIYAFFALFVVFISSIVLTVWSWDIVNAWRRKNSSSPAIVKHNA